MKNLNLFLMVTLAAGLATVTGVNAMHDPCAELHHAINRGDLPAVKGLLANGADPLCEYNLRPEFPGEMYKMSARKLAGSKWIYEVKQYGDNLANLPRNPEKKEKAEAIYLALLEKAPLN